ncbi:hypothetical protein N7510_008149 [Penicillium lagena]|uniref:uncharacterized protein n=1 Tax=Penicillium lagena TaxID=94218 RepID=UPI00253FC153|nr:uncharacterized protein N7510_008159 [Penicillium lagena]XP_056833117.1 uncharacterized protein N7510_008149 [Penicillium lagena]KAJ5605378.1 hypothetical protein N7510_008159 [Penicillium lagena]KAJ5611430.1 hypothetical protein N7510_008149 [Penicillium lagena]
MDLFTFYEPLRVWICQPCEIGVSPHWIESHLRKHHKAHPTASTTDLRRAAVVTAWDRRPWDPACEPFAPPDPTLPPIPGIPTHHGYSCPEPNCDSFATTSFDQMRKHRQTVHPRAPTRPAGRPPAAVRATIPRPQPVSCQRLFTNIKGASAFFIVTPTEPRRRTREELDRTPADIMRAEVDQAIKRANILAEVENQLAPTTRETGTDKTTPWLERTRWPEVVGGHSFIAVARLAIGPDPVTEPVLIVIAESVRRLLNTALTSVLANRINEFDQARLNTFRRRAEGFAIQPLRIHLQPTTVHRYQRIWVRLICFVYRISRPSQPITLRHRLTTVQLAALSRLEEHARDPTASSDQLDRASLDLSIALLDHELKGDIYESVVVGFLAALSIDVENLTYRDPEHYTPFLSAIIKMSQLLVAQRAVQLVDDGQVAYTGDMIDEMRERFLVFGTRTPFHWITRLRAYGKRVQTTSTGLGYLIWSDDRQSLTFREVHLAISDLRRFVETQIELARWDLEQLFLLREDEDSGNKTREGTIPTLPLSQLVDDPINNSRGWNFLSDPRNHAVLPTTGERWLVDHILASDTLREEFISVRQSDSRVRFQKAAVEDYRGLVNQFLRRLLLAIHITSGQPARATELLSVRHRNTPEGRHRNIFIENGLIAIVTAYHKAQGVTNSIRIIHRYLPREVSELLVYYLWLVLPFLEHATMLAAEIPQPFQRSPFLWPRGSSHWPTDSLGAILRQEFATHLHVNINVPTYRHIVIGISRMHLASGGFKKDYGIEESIADDQAAHSAWVAGTAYARMIQEAPGVIESRRLRFRAVSREWHELLGLTAQGPLPSQGARKRLYDDSDVVDEDFKEPAKKRQRYIMIDDD